jgi:hypothetical protein
MGGRGAVHTPTRTLPHPGGGERFEGDAHDRPTLVSPLTGEGQDGGEREAFTPTRTLPRQGGGDKRP